jgi:uncharacterized cupin superfamily protein
MATYRDAKIIKGDLKIRENDGRYFYINANHIVSVAIDSDNDNHTMINTSDNNIYYVKIQIDEFFKILLTHGALNIIRIN